MKKSKVQPISPVTRKLELSLEETVAFLQSQMPPEFAAGFLLGAAVDAARAAGWSRKTFDDVLNAARHQSSLPGHVNPWLLRSPETKA